MDKELDKILSEFEYRGVILLSVRFIQCSEKKMLELLDKKSMYSDNILFKIYFILVLSSFKLTKIDSFNQYLNEMEKLSKLDKYKYAKTCMWRCIYNLLDKDIDGYNFNYFNAKNVFVEQRKYKDLTNLESIVAAMKSKAKMTSANILEHLESAYKYNSLYEDKHTSEFYITIGSLYTMTQNEVDKAINFYHKSISLSKKYKTYDVEALGLYYLAESYALINLKHNCIDILKRLLSDKEYIEFKSVILLSALGLVDYYIENNICINEIKELMCIVEDIMEEEEIDRVMQCRIKCDLCKLKYQLLLEKDGYSEELKKIKEIDYEYETKQYTSTFLNTDYEIEEVYGEVYYRLYDYDNSLIHFKNALKLSNRLEVKFQINSNKNVSKVYKKLKMFKLAYKYMLKANRLLVEIEHNDLLMKYIKAYENYENLKANEREEIQFLSEVSRELKMPIKDIYNSIKLINDSKYSVPLRFKEVYLSNNTSIKKNCLRASRLISNIIDIEKVNTDMLETNFINYNIVYLVEGITLEIANILKNKNINISFDTVVEEINIKCDPYLIEKILLNILYYGIKFSKKNSTVLISINKTNEYIIISYSIDRISLPNNVKNMLFNQKINCEINPTIKGGAVALDLVKKLISLHNGHLTLENPHDHFFEIMISLPNKVYTNFDLMNYGYDISTERVKQHFFDII